MMFSFQEQQGMIWQAYTWLYLFIYLFSVSTSQFANISLPGLQVAYLQPHYYYT